MLTTFDDETSILSTLQAQCTGRRQRARVLPPSVQQRDGAVDRGLAVEAVDRLPAQELANTALRSAFPRPTPEISTASRDLAHFRAFSLTSVPAWICAVCPASCDHRRGQRRSRLGPESRRPVRRVVGHDPRELTELARAGVVQRVHGGAAPLVPGELEVDRPYDEVADDAAAEKRAIARRAVQLVRDGDTVLLDIGTTTGALARELRGRRVTVITPSLAVLDELRTDAVVDVVVLGGLLRRRYHSLVGVLTEEAVRQVRASTVFLGTSGVDANGWVLDTTSVEVPTKRGLIQGADQVVLLADHTKFPGHGSVRVCELGAVSVLVTTTLTHVAALELARASGTEVLLA